VAKPHYGALDVGAVSESVSQTLSDVRLVTISDRAFWLWGEGGKEVPRWVDKWGKSPRTTVGFAVLHATVLGRSFDLLVT